MTSCNAINSGIYELMQLRSGCTIKVWRQWLCGNLRLARLSQTGIGWQYCGLVKASVTKSDVFHVKMRPENSVSAA